MQSGITILHPLALACTLLAGMLILVLPRKLALSPLLVAAIFIPMQQRIVIASIDFYMLRLLLLFGCVRVFLRSEYGNLMLQLVDGVIILFSISGTLFYSLLWGTSEAVTYRLGMAFDILSAYFLFRCMITDWPGLLIAIKVLAFVCVTVALAMLVERITAHNLFAIFGGVPETTVMRDGRLRCQGAFAHPILAGTFGATLLPMILALWWQRDVSRWIPVIGSIAATVITVTSSSSGPVLSWMAAVGAMCLWPLRHRLSIIRLGIVYTLIGLHFVMDAPVWALFMRVKVFGASTSYHRFHLFDQFINHFDDWWVMGVKSTEEWGYYLFDVTNQFVRIAVDGGLVTFILFLAVIWLSFSNAGRALRMQPSHATQRLIWGLGAALFAHVVSFMGVSYFDQIIVIWYMLLAMITTVSALKPVLIATAQD